MCWGPVNADGALVKKPWATATHDEYIFATAEATICPGRPVRAPREAGDLVWRTDEYTDDMASDVHSAWRTSAQARSQRVISAPGTPKVATLGASGPEFGASAVHAEAEGQVPT